MNAAENIPQLDHDDNGHPGGSLPSSERGLDDLRTEAISLGVRIDQRWGATRLQQEIDAALAAPSPADDRGARREPTLHELNMQQWASDASNRDTNEKAAEAAKAAVVQTLAEKRPDGKRTQKNLRASME